jgi:hypothetical protein
MKKMVMAAIMCASVVQVQCSLNDRIAKVNDKIAVVKQNIKAGTAENGMSLSAACGTQHCGNKCGRCNKCTNR